MFHSPLSSLFSEGTVQTRTEVVVVVVVAITTTTVNIACCTFDDLQVVDSFCCEEKLVRVFHSNFEIGEETFATVAAAEVSVVFLSFFLSSGPLFSLSLSLFIFSFHNC